VRFISSVPKIVLVKGRRALHPKFEDRATMCALEGRQHGNQSWVTPSQYGLGPMARDSKEGRFFLPEKGLSPNTRTAQPTQMGQKHLTTSV
jgi:hypothetical protein